MGNQLSGIAPLQIFPVEYYLSDLPEFSYDINLGSTRFFKVARAIYREGLTVAKVFAINDPSLPLKFHRDRVEELKVILNTVPNCLPFQKCMVTDKAGILIRQFVKDNLYDRISTRPFLNNIERKWIAFQLLLCLSHCQNLKVCHGDIKLENILVTSWNWVFLTDFASFKPTYLPEDNPADFSYFFDTSGRRICYIAPERFVKTLSTDAFHNAAVSALVLQDDGMRKGELTPTMDIFSLGCALTELFTEGHSPFDFSQLLAYRNGEYNPWKILDKIDDVNIRELLRSMTEKDADKRLTAAEYLEMQRNKAFPDYFYTFLEKYIKAFAAMPIMSPDEKVHRLKRDVQIIVEAIISCEKKSLSSSVDYCAVNNFSEGLVVIISLLTSSLRALKHCTAKLNALDVMKSFAAYSSPEIILDRLLPSMVHLIKDHDPKVRVAAIETLTDCLLRIKNIPQSGSNVFPEYILPNLLHVALDDAVIVRMAYAENIAILAETALRFLEMTQLTIEQDCENACGNEVQYNHHQVSYDQELQALQELVQQSVTVLLRDSVNAVKQILLERGITRLCVFFGRQKGNDVLLSHMITYLNDKEDSQLRGAFFGAIVGVATYIGWQCCPILKPLLQQGLSDAEEFVIGKALQSLMDLTELGLIQKQMLYDLVAESAPLLCHPNLWIKQGAVGFACAVAKCLSLADVKCRLVPLLQPFLRHNIIQVNCELVLLNSVKNALPRCIFDYLVKLPSLQNLLENLNERRVARNIARPGHPPAYRELDVHLKAAYRRLLSDGMTEDTEDLILAMKDNLLKLHAKKSSTDIRNVADQSYDAIDLGFFGTVPKVCCVLLSSSDYSYKKTFGISQSRKMLKKKVTTTESPTVLMNEEWQHMFGTSDVKSPSSPKPPSHHDLTAVLSQKESDFMPGYCSEVYTSELELSGNISSGISLTEEHYNKASICVPCEEELHSLIEKKHDEWIHDEIVHGSCDVDFKEENVGKQFKSPVGYLIAHLHEHKRVINRIQSVPGTALFATCSNDGTVKIWDCEKMEGKNIANRSRLTYSRLEGPVSCLSVCDNMQSLAAASENGNIHVFRIAYDSTKSPVINSRILDPQEEGFPVDMTYFDTGSQSILAYATVFGSVVGWDLRSPGTAWKLESHPRLGLVTSFCVDYNHCWLVIGTASGNIVCWDLRFQLPITTVSHPTGARIHHMLLHPKRHSTILASVQGNNEVSMWDIETQARVMTLWASTAPPLSQTQASEHAAHSMCWLLGDKGTALLTGGSDMRIRCWNLGSPSDSFLVANAANDLMCPAVISYRSRLIDGTEVVQETYTRARSQTSYDPPRRYPEVPQSGHYDCISDLATVYASQTFIVSGARNGVVKVWK